MVSSLLMGLSSFPSITIWGNSPCGPKWSYSCCWITEQFFEDSRPRGMDDEDLRLRFLFLPGTFVSVCLLPTLRGIAKLALGRLSLARASSTFRWEVIASLRCGECRINSRSAGESCNRRSNDIRSKLAVNFGKRIFTNVGNADEPKCDY